MTTKTTCATCLEKGNGYAMPEAEARLHFDANVDHKAAPESVELPIDPDKVRFVEWVKDEKALQCRAWFQYRGGLYDANEMLHMGVKLPEVPLCDE